MGRMDLLGNFASGIMTPLYYGVTGILLAWQGWLDGVLTPGSGWTWVLAIVGMTVTIRVLLIPLSVQGIKSKRAMQALQPRIQELQKLYEHDRERLIQEQMKLWKESGTNPFASCLPLVLQMPILFAMYRVVELAASRGTDGGEIGFLSAADAESLQEAVFVGSRVGDTLMTFEPITFAESPSTRILAASFIVIMCATQLYSQLQIIRSEPEAAEGAYGQQQKLLLYTLPVVFAIGGLAFPLGVLVHWVTWNLWTMAEQAYVMRHRPGPPASGGMGA